MEKTQGCLMTWSEMLPWQQGSKCYEIRIQGLEYLEGGVILERRVANQSDPKNVVGK